MNLIPNKESVPSGEDLEMIAAAMVEFKQVCLNVFGKDLDRIEPEHLDSVYHYFKKGTLFSKKKRNYAVLVLGSVLGELICRDFGYEWKNLIYDDADGAELGITHKDSYSIGHPYSVVRKRIRSREYAYFVPAYEMFADLIKEEA